MITVVMPVYNAMPYLAAAMASILDQSYSDFRLLAIDDGSTDGSLGLLNGIKDPRVEVIQKQHGGLGQTLALGASLCKTPYLARMDGDDLVHPDRLRLQMAYLEAHPQVGVVGTQFAYIGEGDRKLRAQTLPLRHELIMDYLRRPALALIHASLLMRTEAFQRAGGYRINGMGEDWDLFLRLGQTTRLANLEDELFYYRLHLRNSSLHLMMEHQLGIRYACRCAALRERGEPEIPYDAFRSAFYARPPLQRLGTSIDAFGVAQYRLGLAAIVNGHALQAYSRILFGMACSPLRSVRRIVRRPV